MAALRDLEEEARWLEWVISETPIRPGTAMLDREHRRRLEDRLRQLYAQIKDLKNKVTA